MIEIDNYQSLYSKVVETENNTTIKLNRTTKEYNSKVVQIKGIKRKISSTEKEINRFNNDKAKLDSFKALKKECALRMLKFEVFALIGILVGLSLLNFGTILLTKSPFYPDFLPVFKISLILCTGVSAMIYLGETKSSRKIYRENKKYPGMIEKSILTLEKDKSKDKEILRIYEQQLIGLKNQKTMYEELMAKCLDAKKI